MATFLQTKNMGHYRDKFKSRFRFNFLDVNYSQILGPLYFVYFPSYVHFSSPEKCIGKLFDVLSSHI